MSKRTIEVTVEARVTIEVDVDDMWTWDDIFDEAMDASFDAERGERTITDAQEVD